MVYMVKGERRAEGREGAAAGMHDIMVKDGIYLTY